MGRDRALAVAALGLLLAGGCTTAEQSGRTPAGPAVPFTLLTHCGIDEVQFEGRYYEAVTPLDDGNGNPPSGWGNPTQAGTMRALSPTEVEFRDAAGHVVVFRLRAEATGPKRMCS